MTALNRNIAVGLMKNKILFFGKKSAKSTGRVNETTSTLLRTDKDGKMIYKKKDAPKNFRLNTKRLTTTKDLYERQLNDSVR